MTIQPASYYAPQQVVPAGIQQAAPTNGLAAYQRLTSQGLTCLFHGDAKAGKSSVADSGPIPRLIIDVEGSAIWTPSRKIGWQPDRQPPPPYDGSWDSCLVYVRDADTINRIYEVLFSGRHPFNSVSIDSVTEFQQRIIDKLAGTKQMEQKHWGSLLRQAMHTTRAFNDLRWHPTHPIWSISMVAGTEFRDGKWRPLLQGAAKAFLPYQPDILGVIFAQPDGGRNLWIGPHPLYETGERVGGRLPMSMPLAYPGRQGWTVDAMVRQVTQGG